MVAQIVNLEDPENGKDGYGYVREAEQALERMRQMWRNRGYLVEESNPFDEPYPRYTVTDQEGLPIGTYTIVDDDPSEISP